MPKIFKFLAKNVLFWAYFRISHLSSCSRPFPACVVQIANFDSPEREGKPGVPERAGIFALGEVVPWFLGPLQPNEPLVFLFFPSALAGRFQVELFNVESQEKLRLRSASSPSLLVVPSLEDRVLALISF
jgi:hypothetical protein